MLILQTERLILRDFQPDEFEAFYSPMLDPESQRFYPEKELDPVFMRSIFERVLASANAPERNAYQMAVCLPDGDCIGSFGVRMEDAEHCQASFGGGIQRRYWGMGYASEIALRLLEFGFNHLPIHRLYAETNAENQRARRLVERLGLRQEAEYREAKYFQGRWWNYVIYAILKEEWDQRKILPG